MMKNRIEFKIKKIVCLLLFLILALGNTSFAIDDNNKQTKKERKEKQNSRYVIKTDTSLPDDIEIDKLTIEGGVEKALELNLADCLELALRYNPEIKAQYAQTAATKTLKGQALSNYTPRVNLGLGISRLKPDYSSTLFEVDADTFTHYTVGEIGVSQLVYDFGITQNLYHMRKIEYEAAIADIDKVVNKIICEVKTAYYMLVTSLEKERVMQDTVNKFEQTYEQALAFYQVGMKPKIDVTIAATNLANAKTQYIQSQNNVKIATATLNKVMGLPFIAPYNVEETLPYEEIQIGEEELITIANENSPELKRVALDVKDKEQAWKLSKKSYFPNLALQGIAGWAGNNEVRAKDYWSLGGYLQFDNFSPVLVKHQIDEQRHLYEKQQYTSDDKMNGIYFEIQKTWANFNDAKDRVPVAKLSMKMAKENYELASGRYKVGESDAIELKDAQLQYQNSRLSFYNTLFEYNREKANLEKAIGQTLKSSPADIKEINLKDKGATSSENQ